MFPLTLPNFKGLHVPIHFYMPFWNKDLKSDWFLSSNIYIYKCNQLKNCCSIVNYSAYLPTPFFTSTFNTRNTCIICLGPKRLWRYICFNWEVWKAELMKSNCFLSMKINLQKWRNTVSQLLYLFTVMLLTQY